MPTIFGVPWAELTLEDVQAFLKQADSEPLAWEAKGTRLDATEIRRQVCAFANGHEVGYLILGAQEPSGDGGTGHWTLDGLKFPDEPVTWISNVISDATVGVRPRPDFDTKSWKVTNGHVAVVRISPAATPPCLANGTVYERLPGKSQQVRDPLVLADLYRRGDTAHREASARADRAASAVLEKWLDGEAGVFRTQWVQQEPGFEGAAENDSDDTKYIRFALGVAATGNPPNISGRLFQTGLAEEIWTELCDRPTPGLPSAWGGAPDAVAWSQDSLTWRHQKQGLVDAITIVRAAWDGSVAVGQKLLTEDVYPDSLASSRIGPEWDFADRFVTERLGGFGDVYVTVLVTGGRFPGRASNGHIAMRRGPVLPGIDNELVASLSRELMRAVGNPGPEPA